MRAWQVLRFITKFFPKAELTACDINQDGVDFCKNEFRAHPVYSKHNLKEFNIGKKFDLIWCGSLATHFDINNTEDLLNFFHRHLNVGGLLVFSMHGRRVIEYLRTRECTYFLDNDSIEKILSEVQESGYGYADYPGVKGYGISTAIPEWVKASLEKVGKWRNYRCAEMAWLHHHDIYSVVKE